MLVESATTAHALGYLHGLLFSLNGLGAVAQRSGDPARAVQTFAAAQSLREQLAIDHDPDDALVAHTRAAALAAVATNRLPVELELDAAVAAAVAPS